MKCPYCLGNELVFDVRSLSYNYKGETLIIRDVEGEFCTECGEGMFNVNVSSRISDEMLKFKKQIDSNL